jgi:hypothetical protein
MTVKDIFDKAEDGTLTWSQFSKLANGAKFVDLTEGNYVSKQKHDDEISQRDARITDLTETITKRDADLETLQQTLKDAGDIEALKKASQDLTELQKRYNQETKDYQVQLKQQAYEFAVREFANSKNFSSNAAKRDFIQSMIEKQLKLEDGRIIGAEDFVQLYSKDNDDAFMKEAPVTDPKPKFAQTTDPKQSKKLSLSEMMKMANENPGATFDI